MYAELRRGRQRYVGAVTRAAPDYGCKGRDGLEKNWTFFESDDELYALYAPWRWELVRIDHEGRCDTVRGEKLHACRVWDYDMLSGGTPPQRMPDGRFLTLLHSFTMSGATRVYHVLAAVFAGEPPFALERISAAPILSGSAGWPLAATPANANPPWSVFPAGHVLDGDRVVVSLGINDCRCAIAELSLAGLDLVAPSFR